MSTIIAIIINNITNELTLFLILSLLFILYKVSEAVIMAYVPLEAKTKAKIFEIPIKEKIPHLWGKLLNFLWKVPANVMQNGGQEERIPSKL